MKIRMESQLSSSRATAVGFWKLDRLSLQSHVLHGELESNERNHASQDWLLGNFFSQGTAVRVPNEAAGIHAVRKPCCIGARGISAGGYGIGGQASDISRAVNSGVECSFLARVTLAVL